MDQQNRNIFIKWLIEKYGSEDVIDHTETTEEWWANEEAEFKKYHPFAGTFVRNLTTDEFMEWVNKLRNK